MLCVVMPGVARAACTVASSGVAFGTYNPFSATPTDTTGTVTVTCSAGAGSGTYTVALSAGSGTYAARRMTSGSSLMSYQVYSDAARSVVWGDGTSGTAKVTPGDNRPQAGGATTLTVYGRIPAQLIVAPGGYTDTLTVTVTY